MPTRNAARPVRSTDVTVPATPRPVRIPGDLSVTNFSVAFRIVLIAIIFQLLAQNLFDLDFCFDPLRDTTGNQDHSEDRDAKPHPFRHVATLLFLLPP